MAAYSQKAKQFSRNRGDHVQGTVYLLCYAETPLAHAKHYLGWALDLDARIEHHRKGTGSRLTQVLKEHGIEFKVSATWQGDRYLERKLKNRGGKSKFCPECKARQAAEKAAAKLAGSVEVVA